MKARSMLRGGGRGVAGRGGEAKGKGGRGETGACSLQCRTVSMRPAPAHALLMWRHLLPAGNARFKQRLEVMVTELGKVQGALGSGYLSAFPEEHFDRAESLAYVWAPYYVVRGPGEGRREGGRAQPARA